MKFNRTKIIATIGPATASLDILTKLIEEGVNIVRLNFSHGNYDDHLKVIENVRTINKQSNLNIALLQDLQGPKLRIGELENDQVILESNSELILTSKKIIGNSKKLFVSYDHLATDVQPGERILLDDGKIELMVMYAIDESDIKVKVIYGGVLSPRKGVNFPNTQLSIPSLTEKDLADLEFGLNHQVE